MATTYSEQLQIFLNLLNDIFSSSAATGSISAEDGNNVFTSLKDLLEIHANDADLHSGENALPTTTQGGLLVKGADAWEALAASDQYKALMMNANSVVNWAYILTFLSMAFEADGYAYPAIDMTTGDTVLHVFGKNIKFYDRFKNKYVYLAYSDSKTFEIALPIDSENSYTTVYLVCSMAALHAATSGGTIALSVVSELASDHLVLLENKTGTGTSRAQGAGLLRNLFAQYQSLQQNPTTVTVTDSVATINTAKFDKAQGLFYIANDANFTINTTNSYLLGNGKIIIYNSGSAAITVTFTTSFAGKTVSIAAGERKVFMYARVGTSSYFMVDALSAIIPYDLGFAISDAETPITTDNWDQRTVARACTISTLVASANVAPTGNSVVITFYQNGTSIGTVTLAIGELYATTTLTTAVSVAVGDIIKAAVTTSDGNEVCAGIKVEPLATL